MAKDGKYYKNGRLMFDPNNNPSTGNNPYQRKIAPNREGDPAYARKARNDMVRGMARKAVDDEIKRYNSHSKAVLERTGARDDVKEPRQYTRPLSGLDKEYVRYRDANDTAAGIETREEQTREVLRNAIRNNDQRKNRIKKVAKTNTSGNIKKSLGVKTTNKGTRDSTYRKTRISTKGTIKK